MVCGRGVNVATSKLLKTGWDNANNNTDFDFSFQVHDPGKLGVALLIYDGDECRVSSFVTK